VFELADVVEADEERDDADHAEAAIDETPVRRYAADGSGDESKGDDTCAGYQAELEYPLIADGIYERTDESDGDDEVGEGEPIGAVGHERIRLVGVDDAVVNAAEPCVQGGFAGGWLCRTYMKDLIQDCGLALEREGGDAAEDESNDEEYEPESDPAEMMRGACGHGFSVVSGSGFGHTCPGMKKNEGPKG